MAVSMTLADWCIFAAGLLVPFAFTVYAKASKDFDNNKPRDYMEKIAGARKRAYWAVQNGYETFPLFAVAVLLAERAAASQVGINIVALTFLLCRLVYGLMYVLDKATLRSLVWVVATACIVILFVMAA